MISQMKALEDENRRLKKMYAEMSMQLIPGFTITPEVSYTKWNDNKSVLKGDDAWQGMVRFQCTF